MDIRRLARISLGALLAAGAAFVIAAMLLYACTANAQELVHLKDASPETQEWMMHLQNGWGALCCDFNEAVDLKDAEWDTEVVNGEGHYRVYVKPYGGWEGGWVSVEEKSIVKPPVNRYGPALAWVIYRDGVPWIKCFLPGAGT